MATIPTGANICSVQFSPDSPHLIAAGSANYRIYMYDLRNPSLPLAAVPGHLKTVSYVRFMGASHLVSASTDNTLRLWDVAALSATGSQHAPPPAAEVIFTGHTNQRNFVGLSVTPEGYIACGSENNTVYCYHRALPLPVASYRLAASEREAAGGIGSGGGLMGGGRLAGGGSRAGSGHQHQPQAQEFVSSVCWSRSGRVLLAGSSGGDIKVLSLA